MSEEMQRVILAKLEGIERMLEGGRAAEDLSRPLSAAELCERWQVRAESKVLRLQYLARKCRAWGLEPMKGGRGEYATYARAAVLKAEAYAAGTGGRKAKKLKR